MSRLQKILDEGEEPYVPESPLPYLTDLLFEIGPTMPGGFGPAPLSEVEIQAWQYNRRTKLTAWDTKTVRELSRVFVAEMVRAEAQDAAAPCIDEDLSVMRERVARKVEDFFG